MKKIILTTTIGLLMAVAAMAQTKHEFSVNAFGGLQSLNYKLEQGGSHSGGFGGGGGIGYAFNLNTNWSVGTGLDFSYYGAKAEYSQFSYTYEGTEDLMGKPYTFSATATNYQESQSALLLEIPVVARYTLPLGASNNSLRFVAGFKFGFPVSTNYTTSAGNLQTSGSYTFENQKYENISGIFMNAALPEQSGDFSINTSIQLTLEAAYRIAIGEKSGLSIGVYFNYGLNDIQSKSDLPPIAFEPSNNTPVAINSLIDSNFASSVRPMAVGVKVRFDLGF